MTAGKGLTGPAQLQQFQPRAAINITVAVTLRNDNTPEAFPAVRVPPGLIPVLRARSANVQSVFVSLYAVQLLAGQGREIVTGGASGSAISFPADRLDQVWVMGKRGDVLIAEISGAPIG
jgi:hypothetical protein